MKVILETPRFILREKELSDAREMYELNLDPEVIKYTGDPPFESVAEARTFIQNYQDYKNHGMGRWVVETKENSEYVGWCGLKFHLLEGFVDLGFRFHRKFWNQGIATETAFACLEYGFEELALKKIVGRSMKENTPSIKVLEKIGMHYVREFEGDLHNGVWYEIDRAVWQKNTKR